MNIETNSSLNTSFEIINHSIATVQIKNALPDELQQWLLEFALDIGKKEHENGFYMKKDDQYLLNMGNRGRIYRELRNFPNYQKLKHICNDLVKIAQQGAPKLPDMTITHLLLVYYDTEDGMSWHIDNDKNDGDNDHPIVSISLGSTCVFGMKPLFKEEMFTKIESGDVVVWGGPERNLMHNVERVDIGTSPFKNLKGRLNFTFRSAPNVLDQDYDTKSFWVDQ